MKRTLIILLDCLILAGVLPGCGTAIMSVVEAIKPGVRAGAGGGPGFVQVVPSVAQRDTLEHQTGLSQPEPAPVGAIAKAAAEPEADVEPAAQEPAAQKPSGPAKPAVVSTLTPAWDKPLLPKVKATTQPVERSVASPGGELDSAVQGLVAKLGKVKILKTTVHNESGDPSRLVALYAVNHREMLVVDPIDEEGRVSPKALALFEELLRSARTDDTHAIDPMLVRLLHAVALAHDGVLMITSGYREPGHGTKPTSQHTMGKAADVRHPYLPAKSIVDFAREWGAGGVGYYPKSGFVHLDVREVPYYWVDTSGKGEKGQAVADKYGLLAAHAAAKYEGLELPPIDESVSEVIEDEPAAPDIPAEDGPAEQSPED
jgi:uncharacterized protein YcbK (DUF882 family)